MGRLPLDRDVSVHTYIQFDKCVCVWKYTAYHFDSWGGITGRHTAPTCVNRCSRGERRVSDLWCVHMYIHAFNLTQDITMMYAGCVCVDTAV